MQRLEDSLEDGMRLQMSGFSGSGRIVEVFAPRWWRVDRWLRWLFNPKRRSTFTTINGAERVLEVS